jgi:hypothetical protein
MTSMAEFELSELRFLACCLIHCNSKEKKNRQITARVTDFCTFFPMDQKSAYGVLKQVVVSLGKNLLDFKSVIEYIFITGSMGWDMIVLNSPSVYFQRWNRICWDCPEISPNGV